MGKRFFLFIVILFAAAVILREDFIFILLYLAIGVFWVGRWWGGQALQHVTVRRIFNPRAFLGETIEVKLKIENRGWLPLAWLQARESLPVGMGIIGPFQQVNTLGPKGRLVLSYSLDCLRRSYYPLGPLDLFSGDVLGAGRTQQFRVQPDYLTVYPKIVPISRVRLPSHSPLGTLRHHQPIFEDPSRFFGKRPYQRGDSLRRVDWKTTASSGQMQVKLFEPSIALETAIFLDLNTQSYPIRRRYDLPELAIVIAASLANWVIGARQSVGLVTNGIDPVYEDHSPLPLSPGRGRGHLIRLLEMLARVQAAESLPLTVLLEQNVSALSWGASLVVITGRMDEALFDALFNARRSGLNATLVQCGPTSGFEEIRRKARYFGFPLHEVLDEHDIEVWEV